MAGFPLDAYVQVSQRTSPGRVNPNRVLCLRALRSSLSLSHEIFLQRVSTPGCFLCYRSSFDSLLNPPATATMEASRSSLQAPLASSPSHSLALRPAVNGGRGRMPTGLDCLILSTMQMSNFSAKQMALFARIDELIPSSYPPPHKFRICRRILGRAILFVCDTCPADLLRDLPRSPVSLWDCCHFLAALIPATFFLTSGPCLERFLTGVILFLQRQPGCEPITSSPRQPGQQSILTPPTSSDPILEERARNLSATISPGGASRPSQAQSAESVYIKIESGDESEKGKECKSRKRKDRRSKEPTPNKKRRKSNTGTGDAANTGHEEGERTRSVTQKAKTPMNTTKPRKPIVAAPSVVESTTS